MNRRGVLGMLGIGAAAPAIIRTNGPIVDSVVPSTQGSAGHFSDMVTPWDPVEQLAEAKKEYEIITSQPAKWMEDFITREWQEYLDGYSSYRIENIDPDIRAMKSFSENAKMRLYLERKARRRHERYLETLSGRIQQIMRGIP